MTSEILNSVEKRIVDESMQEHEHHEYEPQARTNLNTLIVLAKSASTSSCKICLPILANVISFSKDA